MSHPAPNSSGAYQPPHHRNHHNHHNHHHHNHNHNHNHHNRINISSNDEQYSAASLRRSYRAFASALIVAARGAEKVATTSNAAAAAASDAQAAAPPGTPMAAAVPSPALVKASQDAKLQYNNSIQIFLKQKTSMRRTTTTLESKLRGEGKDIEALNCLLKSSPCVGIRGRKRKFES
mmetsp:Transcript_23040/g.46204  ORF Transcript_23040/g.46204 Transcript_23040/m.46204 type:complete len:177 (-) Transcript_23040:238-768(-)